MNFKFKFNNNNNNNNYSNNNMNMNKDKFKIHLIKWIKNFMTILKIIFQQKKEMVKKKFINL